MLDLECNLQYLLILHGLIRWLVLAVGGAALLAVLRHAGRPTRILGGTFVGLLDAQLVLGALLLLLDSQIRPARIPHALLMGLAVLVAHGLRIRQKKHPETGPALVVAAVVVPLLLIFVGLGFLQVKP